MLKVIDHNARCPSGTRLVWTQKGPTGATGSPGVSSHQICNQESKRFSGDYGSRD